MSLISILQSIFPFLFNAAKQQWKKLPKDQQQALLHGTGITQIIKDNLDKTETEVKYLIIVYTGLPSTDVNSILDNVFKEFNVVTLGELQTLLKGAENTLNRNGILTTIASAISIFISGGKLTWEGLLIGLLQFAYKQFVK